MLKEKDRSFLRELIKDSRKKIVRLAEKCHMSRQSVYRKINDFKRRGIEFTVDINPEVIGLNLRAYILIVAEPQTKFRKESDKKIRKLKEVSQIHYILGRFDIIVEVLVKDRKELRKVLREIQGLSAVKKTETFVVYETTKLSPKEPLLRVLES